LTVASNTQALRQKVDLLQYSNEVDRYQAIVAPTFFCTNVFDRWRVIRYAVDLEMVRIDQKRIIFQNENDE
jgi:hypothetical protein